MSKEANLRRTDVVRTILLNASSEGDIYTVKYIIRKGANPNSINDDGYTPLYIASREGHLHVVECLVNAGADVKKVAKDGTTPVVAASYKGRVDIVKYLISQGANPNLGNNDGYTPLHVASKEGYLHVVECLVNAGADVKKAIQNGLTSLGVASYSGHVDIVKYLLSQGLNPNLDDIHGCTSMVLASLEGHLHVVESLVNAGADVKKDGKNGMTSLYAASYAGHVDIVKYLISQGANPNTVASNGCIPLHSASREGHLHVVECLVNAGADMNKVDKNGLTSLGAASQIGHVDIVTYLISQGATPNSVDSNGHTPLHIASGQGHLHVVECLVNAGADVNKAEANDVTPLDVASYIGHLDIVNYLISQGAHLDPVNNDGHTPLHIASTTGNLHVVECLVNAGADVNKVDKSSATSLDAASNKGYVDIAKYLISQGAHLDPVNNDGCTSLHIASVHGHLHVVECLVNAGADVNKIDENGTTSLHAASYTGHVDIVKCLISKGANPNSVDNRGYTSLHIASQEGHLDVVECLATSGADVKKAAKDGVTPLNSVSFSDHVETLKFLISQGANPNSVDNDGNTSLHIASQEGHLHVVECLVNAGASVKRANKNGTTSLYAVSCTGHVGVVKYLISQGANPNTVNNDGYTPLHIASLQGHLDVVECLVSAGADVKKAARKGATSLHSASYAGHVDIVEYLISQGAYPNSVNNDGVTSLHIASQEGHFHVVECLGNAGADVKKVAKNGAISLVVASYAGHVDIVKCLISLGAKPNSVNNAGYTPLHVASGEGHLNVVGCLVKAGADVKKAAKDGMTPLNTASERGHVDIVKYLISQGANPNPVNNYGHTPLHIASQKGHLHVVECLVSAGGDVNIPAIDGDLPLHAASRGGKLDIIKYLITKGADIEARNKFGWTVFHFAADNGHLEALEYFLRNSPRGESGKSHNDLEVGFQTLKGVTPLMAAARGGHLDCVRLLLENNADIETVDAEGWTFVHYAAASGNEIMKNLLDRKAVMSTRISRRGQSPISIALSSGIANTARVLLDKDATSIHHSDSAGRTPIHLATVSGLSSIIEKLVSLGAGVNPQSHDGQTPLHVAIRLCHCKKRQVEVTAALKQIQQESDDDLSPAEALIQFLINQGSKVDIKDNEGFTPVQYTRDERVRQMVLRSLSEDDVHEFRDLPIARSTEINRIIGCEGGVLHLDSCDVTMSIPPRTVQAGSCHDVSIALVTDDPPPIREGEFLTGHGIGITFPAQWRYSTCKPVTLNMPHAATVVKSSAVQTDIIWKHTESASAHRDDGYTQCILKKRDTKFVIDASSVIQDKVQLWIPIKLHEHALGKRMVCTPFLPIDMAQGEDIALRIYIHEDIPYIVQKIQEQEENLLYHQVHPGRCFGLEPESSDLELECNGEIRIISAKDLFNRQKTLVSMPIKTEINAKSQMINISISATSTNQPKASMSFVVIHTGFSANIHSTLDEMVPGSNVDLRNAEDFLSEEFITKEINTDKYYHLGLALGLSYQTLDSIQFRSRQHEEAGVYTPNQKAVIFMIRYWKCLQHSVSLADDHLREVWKSVSDSGDLASVLKQRQSVEKQHDTNVEEVFEGEFPRKEPRTTPTVGLHDLEVMIPEARGRWAKRLHHIKRTKTPSVRSDSLSSFSTVLEEEEGRFPKHYLGKFFKPPSFEISFDNLFRFDASMTLPSVAHACSAALQLRIDEHREDEEVEHSKQAVMEWMKSGEGVKTADFRPQEYTAKLTDDEGQKTESVHHMSPPSARQDEIPIDNLESREDLGEDTVMIRLEKHGIEVRIPPNEACRAKDVTVEPIHDIPTKEENNTGITETSLGDAVSTSSRPSQSTSVDIPFQDAPAAAREVSTSTERVLCIDEQHKDEDRSSATGIFGALGGKLPSKSHGLTLHIPPGALQEDENISLRVLTEIPNGLTLKDDEILVSHGFQCYPSGLRFKKPVKLTIPHCAIVTAPNRVQTILYSWNQSGTPKRLPHSSDIICSVQERWLEVSMSHFSGGYFALIWDWLFLKGILLSCMSFLPRVLPSPRIPILEVRFVKMPHDQKWQDVHALKKSGSQPVKDDDDIVVFRRSTLTVSCQLGANSPETDAIQHSNLSLKPKDTVYFTLDLTDESDETLVTLNLVQLTTQKIKFNTRFQGIDDRFAEQDTPTLFTFETATDKSREHEFGDILEKVAEQIYKNAEINSLGRELGFQPPEIQRYIQTNEKYQTVTYMGTLSMLRDWRNRTTRSEEHEKLKRALIVLKHHRLVDDLLNDNTAS